MFDTVESGQIMFGMSSFLGFIPYIIVFLLKSFQASILSIKNYFKSLFKSDLLFNKIYTTDISQILGADTTKNKAKKTTLTA